MNTMQTTSILNKDASLHVTGFVVDKTLIARCVYVVCFGFDLHLVQVQPLTHFVEKQLLTTHLFSLHFDLLHRVCIQWYQPAIRAAFVSTNQLFIQRYQPAIRAAFVGTNQLFI